MLSQTVFISIILFRLIQPFPTILSQPWPTFISLLRLFSAGLTLLNPEYLIFSINTAS